MSADSLEEADSKYDPCMGEEGYQDSWLDRTQAFLTRKLCEPAVWFDNFFGSERTVEEGQPGTFVRWRIDFRLMEDEDFDIRNQINASVSLPKASRRLKLILAGETAKDPTDVLPDDTTDPAFDTEEDDEQLRIGLHLDALDTPKSKFSINGNVRFKIPLEPFVRARYRYTHPIGNKALARFTQTGYWEDPEGFGEITRVEFERLLTPYTLLRWSSSGTYSEVSTGLDWGSELVWFHQITPEKAVSVNVATSGVTRPSVDINRYRIGTRFRTNFYRRWLFYELEPEVSWLKTENGDFDFVSALTFRVEVQFGSKE
jgi:hypothetical protein